MNGARTWSRWAIGLLVLAALAVGAGYVRATLLERESEGFYREAMPRAALVVTDMGPVAEAVPESSGLAAARSVDGVLWTHNDSGDRPVIYALDRTGVLLGSFEVAGAGAVDWEAMDIGPCPGPDSSQGSCLYLADVGDNEMDRASVTVYVVHEPAADEAGGLAHLGDPIPLVGALTLAYPQGPDDVEGVAVAPDGTLVIVTKGRRPEIRVHRASPGAVAGAMKSGQLLVLDDVTILPIDPNWNIGRAVTGAAIDPSGTRLAVRTYTEIYLFSWPGLELDAPVCFLGPLEPQGEAIAFDAQGTLWLTSETSERGTGHVLTVQCGTGP